MGSAHDLTEMHVVEPGQVVFTVQVGNVKHRGSPAFAAGATGSSARGGLAHEQHRARSRNGRYMRPM
jgi:hypothetical protein